MTQKEDRAGQGGPWPHAAEGEIRPRCVRDATDATREHMREMAVARQAAERRGGRPTTPLGGKDHTAEMHTALARIDAAHRLWVRDQGEDD